MVPTGSKLSIIRIVQVLLRDSDRSHPLSQQDILTKLDEDFGMVVSRKSVGRNLMRLKEAGLPVVCREVPRMVNGKETTLSLDWYWDHILTPEDLKTVIDTLYFSHLSTNEVRSLSDKLKHIQSRSFLDGKEWVWNLPQPQRCTVLADTAAVLLQALKDKKQISFHYDRYGVDGKKYHHTTEGGTEMVYRGTPFRVVASDGRYALLINLEGSADLSAFFLDLMSDVEILPEAAKPQKTVDSLEQGEKLMDFLYPVEHLYVGSPELCTFEADRELMTDIVYDFGKAATVKSAGQSKITVEVTAPPAALKAWALSHAPHVKIISPAPLVKEFREAGEGLARLYGVS